MVCVTWPAHDLFGGESRKQSLHRLSSYAQLLNRKKKILGLIISFKDKLNIRLTETVSLLLKHKTDKIQFYLQNSIKLSFTETTKSFTEVRNVLNVLCLNGYLKLVFHSICHLQAN